MQFLRDTPAAAKTMGLGLALTIVESRFELIACLGNSRRVRRSGVESSDLRGC